MKEDAERFSSGLVLQGLPSHRKYIDSGRGLAQQAEQAFVTTERQSILVNKDSLWLQSSWIWNCQYADMDIEGPNVKLLALGLLKWHRLLTPLLCVWQGYKNEWVILMQTGTRRCSRTYKHEGTKVPRSWHLRGLHIPFDCCSSYTKCFPEACVLKSWSPPGCYLRRGGKAQRGLVGGLQVIAVCPWRGCRFLSLPFWISGREVSDLALTTTTILPHTPNHKGQSTINRRF